MDDTNWEALRQLADDSVTGVRIGVARLAKTIYGKHHSDAELQMCIIHRWGLYRPVRSLFPARSPENNRFGGLLATRPISRGAIIRSEYRGYPDRDQRGSADPVRSIRNVFASAAGDESTTNPHRAEPTIKIACNGRAGSMFCRALGSSRTTLNIYLMNDFCYITAHTVSYIFVCLSYCRVFFHCLIT